VFVGLATPRDLEGIIALQRANLESALDPGEMRAQGFVTVAHTPAILERMHAMAPSIVARSGDEIVGYALTMPVACKSLVPLLEPMFTLFARLEAGGRPLRDSRFYVCGQVCVARAERGSGIFDALYRAHAENYAASHDWIVTQISMRNPRSIRAHARVGFREIARYQDAHDDWSVVAWDFR